MTDFNVNPDELQNDAQAFWSVAAAADSITRMLLGPEFSFFAGDDEVGLQIMSQWRQGIQPAIDLTKMFSASLLGAGKGLQDNAAKYRAQEEANAAGAASIPLPKVRL